MRSVQAAAGDVADCCWARDDISGVGPPAGLPSQPLPAPLLLPHSRLKAPPSVVSATSASPPAAIASPARFSSFAAAAAHVSSAPPSAEATAPSAAAAGGDAGVGGGAAGASETPGPVLAAAAAAPAAAPAGPGAELMMRRGQLLDSLAACLGMHQLDALLANERNRAVFDEMLLVTALDAANRLHGSAASSSTAPSGSSPSLSSPSSPTAASGAKSAVDAAADVLTRLSELFIQLLSEPGALSPEGAVRALRTLAALRFNPAGELQGLETMSAFYRETVVPLLDPARGPPPELALRAPLLLVDLFFAFARLFDVAARRDRELQAQLQAAQAREEEAAARAEADAEASDRSGGGGGTSTVPRGSAAAAATAPHAYGMATAGQRGVIGDVALYDQIRHLLVDHGMLTNLPSKTLGMLATAIATSGYYNFPLCEALSNQTMRRLAPAASASPAALYGGDGGGPVTAGGSGNGMPPSTLANIVYSLAKVRHPHEGLYETAAHWMMARMPPGGGGGGGVHVGQDVGVHHVVDMAVAFARVKYDNVDFLLRAADALLPRMSQATPNSASMMAWALANTRSGRSVRFEPLLSALCGRVAALWRRSRAAAAGGGGSAVLTRHLSCIAYAAGRLDLRPPALPALLDAVAADVVSRADEYQARQLCNVLVAFQRLQSYRPDLFAAACAVLRRRLEVLEPHGWEAVAASGAAAPHAFGPAFTFGPQNYADAAWAVALSGQASAEGRLMQLLADRVAETAGQLGKACLVRAAQAFAVADVRDRRVFDALAQAAQPVLMELGPPYQAVLIDAFAEVQAPVSEDFWLACLDAVGIKVPHLQDRADRPDMQAAAAQLAAAFRRHPATAAYPRCASHSALPLLYQLEADARAAGSESGG